METLEMETLEVAIREMETSERRALEDSNLNREAQRPDVLGLPVESRSWMRLWDRRRGLLHAHLVFLERLDCSCPGGRRKRAV